MSEPHQLKQALLSEMASSSALHSVEDAATSRNPAVRWIRDLYGEVDAEASPNAARGLNAVLGQYAQFRKAVCGLLLAGRERVRTAALAPAGASWRPVEDELTRNIGEELGTETNGVSYYQALRDGLCRVAVDDPNGVDPNSSTRTFLARLRDLCGASDPSCAIGAIFAVEAAAPAEMKVIDLFVQYQLVQAGVLKNARAPELHDFLAHLGQIVATHRDRLFTAMENILGAEQERDSFAHGFRETVSAFEEWWQAQAELLVRGSRSEVLLGYLQGLLYGREVKVQGEYIPLGLDNENCRRSIRALVPMRVFFGKRALPLLALDVSHPSDVSPAGWEVKSSAWLSEDGANTSLGRYSWVTQGPALFERARQRFEHACVRPGAMLVCTVVKPPKVDTPENTEFFKVEWRWINTGDDIQKSLQEIIEHVSNRVQSLVFLFGDGVPPLTPTRRLMTCNLLSELAAEVVFAERLKSAGALRVRYEEARWFAHEVKNWTNSVPNDLSYCWQNLQSSPDECKTRILRMLASQTILSCSSAVINSAYIVLLARMRGEDQTERKKEQYSIFSPRPLERTRELLRLSVPFLWRCRGELRRESDKYIDFETDFPPLIESARALAGYLGIRRDDSIAATIVSICEHQDFLVIALLLREALWNVTTLREQKTTSRTKISVRIGDFRVEHNRDGVFVVLPLIQRERLPRPLEPDHVVSDSMGAIVTNQILGTTQGLKVGSINRDKGPTAVDKPATYELTTEIHVRVKTEGP
ncbi:MAG TPA: DUF3865 domain-containing protein [Nannocystaceae bacterium]|nr:DUF3865 domain-containing protein [Nannocystaceae bacterium]